MDMESIQALELHSEGEKNGIPFSLSSVPATVVNAVLERIPVFVAGSNASPKTKSQIEASLMYSFENGSLGVKAAFAAAMVSTIQATGFCTDMAAISEGRLADVVDRGRLQALEEMKKELVQDGATAIRISSDFAHVEMFDIAGRNLEQQTQDDIWVDSETYVMATLLDMGGKTRSNVHLELDDRRIITADSQRNYLAGITENLIYKTVLAHVAYKVNLKTNEWRDIHLVSISLPGMTFDSEEFDRAVSRPNAWDAVPDPVAEIRRMRGADA